MGGERSGRLTIDKDGEGRGGNAGINKEVGRKAHSAKGSCNEIPIKTVEGFSKIKLKKENLVHLTLQMEGVDNFLSDDNIGRNMPVLNKSSLGVIDVVGKIGFKSIC
jgi:hypothetical protein